MKTIINLLDFSPVSVIAFFVTLLWWIIEAGVSKSEGTFSHRQKNPPPYVDLEMSFLQNWSISIGMPIFAVINFLVAQRIYNRISSYNDIFIDITACVLFLMAGYVMTFLLYFFWHGHNENLGHVFKRWSSPTNWTQDITNAGFVHFVFLVFQIAIVLLYIFLPMGIKNVIAVQSLLLVFIIIINLQAKFIQKSCNLAILLIQIIALAVITAIKML